MNKKMVVNRVFGALLIFVLVFPSVNLGYRISSNFSVLSIGLFWPLIFMRLFIFGLAFLMLYKLLRPYSTNMFLAIKPGSNLLFDGEEHPLSRVTLKLVLGILLSSFLFGVGVFGFVTLLVKLLSIVFRA